MKQPLTQIELDLLSAHGCQNPGCDHKSHTDEIFLHPACHPGDGTWTKYEKGGLLTVICLKCRATIVKIKVAAT